MKNYYFVLGLICACFVTPSVSQAQKGHIDQVTTQVTSVSMNFQPPPKGLTNFPTIGLPIIVVPENLVTNLGGSDATNMAATSISDMLINSGLFTLSYADKPQYECQVSLVDLGIQQWEKKSGWNIPPVILNISNILHLSRLIYTNFQASVNWSNDETEMSVHCSVSIQIIDSNSKAAIAGNEGEVNQEDTTRNIKTEIGGLTTNSGKTITDTVHFESGLVELASYYALTNMLPQLDAKLLQLQSLSSSTSGTNVSFGSIELRLEELNKLHTNGIINDDDYQKKKAEILNTL
jgi:hypothetical protein